MPNNEQTSEVFMFLMAQLNIISKQNPRLKNSLDMVTFPATLLAKQLTDNGFE